MKAARFHQHGPPSVIRYEDAPDPAPRPGRAIVRVRACALNHLDLWERRGLDRVRIPLPHISGSDVSGDVAEAGRGDVPVGTRVMLQPGLGCGSCQYCRAGRDNLCGSYVGTRGELLAAAPLFFEGRLRPVIDEVLPLSQAACAHERLEAHEQFGKIVLTP